MHSSEKNLSGEITSPVHLTAISESAKRIGTFIRRIDGFVFSAWYY